MFIWRTLDKSAMAGLLRLMAENDARAKARTARGTASGQAPKADADIVPPRTIAKPRKRFAVATPPERAEIFD